MPVEIHLRLCLTPLKLYSKPFPGFLKHFPTFAPVWWIIVNPLGYCELIYWSVSVSCKVSGLFWSLNYLSTVLPLSVCILTPAISSQGSSYVATAARNVQGKFWRFMRSFSTLAALNAKVCVIFFSWSVSLHSFISDLGWWRFVICLF